MYILEYYLMFFRGGGGTDILSLVDVRHSSYGDDGRNEAVEHYPRGEVEAPFFFCSRAWPYR